VPTVADHKPNHPHRVSLDKALLLLSVHETWQDLLLRRAIDQDVLVDAWMEDSLVYIAIGARGVSGDGGVCPRFAVALVNTKEEEVLAIRLVNFELTGRFDDVETLFESARLGKSVASVKGFRFDSSTISDEGRK
jgi:hypothetical protein